VKVVKRVIEGCLSVVTHRLQSGDLGGQVLSQAFVLCPACHPQSRGLETHKHIRSVGAVVADTCFRLKSSAGSVAFMILIYKYGSDNVLKEISNVLSPICSTL